MVMAFQWLLFMTMLLSYRHCQGEPSCTMGFPPSLTEFFDADSRCNSSLPSVRVLYPQMKIVCDGTLVRWRAAGGFLPLGNASNNLNSSYNFSTVLSIWRERKADLETYDRVGGITLGFCGNIVATRVSDVIFECTLPQNSSVSVQTGDIIGVEVMTDMILNLGYQIFYNRTASGMTSYQFNEQTSSTVCVNDSDVCVNDSDVCLTAIPQISLTVEPPVKILDTTQSSTTSVPVTTTTLSTCNSTGGSTLNTVLIEGTAPAGVVIVVVLSLVITVFVIKMICKCRKSETILVGAKMEEASQVSKSMEVNNEYHEARYVDYDNTYDQLVNKEVVHHAEQHHYDNDNMVTQRRYEQVPSNKLQYKKGTAPAISSDHLGSHGLYTSPKTKNGSAKVQQVSGARYETISGYERATVYENANIYEMPAVYEQASMYEKAMVYEQVAVYEEATTYEEAAMYERAVTYERAATYEKAPPSELSQLQVDQSKA